MTSSAAMHIAAAAALLCAAAQPARADVYWFTDDDGSVHLSNVPAGRRYERLIAAPPAPASAAPVPPASSGPASAAARTAAAAAAGERAGRHAASRAATRYDAAIDQVARAYALEAALLRAVVSVESAFDPRAVSDKGAGGLMQLMPATARRYGVTDPFDPEQNLHGGARYLRDLLGQFGGDLKLALAAYNAGELNVIRHGHSVPPFRETRDYVPKVLDLYHRYRAARRIE